jgi:hypothetical protein
MTSGSRHEMSICQGRLEASTVFGPVLESSKFPLSIPRALHGCEVNGALVILRRGCLARSLLGDDVFPRGGVQWTSYSTPCTGLRQVATY